MKKLLITLLFSAGAFCAAMSQSAMYEISPSLSSQLFSRINFNPAASGNDKNINVFSLTKLQWLGFEGGPTTSLINVHGYVERIKSGIGGSFYYDKIGINKSSLNAQLSYSYQIDLSEKSLLALGVSAGMMNSSNDYFNNHKLANSTDPILLAAEPSKTVADFDFGLEFSTKALLIGAAVNHLGYMGTPENSIPPQSYYGYIRGVLPIGKTAHLAPALMYMKSSLASSTNINATVFVKEKTWVGLGYRTGQKSGGLQVFFGLQTGNFRIGYGYELGMAETMNLNNNSHELTLSYILKKKKVVEDPKAKGKAKGKKKK